MIDELMSARKILTCLNDREKLAYVYREAYEMTYAEIGEHLGIGKQRSSDLHKKAVRKINRCIASMESHDFPPTYMRGLQHEWSGQYNEHR